MSFYKEILFDRPKTSLWMLMVCFGLTLFGTGDIWAADKDNSVSKNWPGWRGDGSGISKEANLPLYWNDTQNIAWKTSLPGQGNSSPIVWGERVFLTASLDGWKKRIVICINANDGNILWQTEINSDVKTETIPKSGYAAPTPVTDGERVYVLFDRPGLVALDMKGNIVWTHSFGDIKSQYNIATSPILYKDTVIVCCDNAGESFIVAIDSVKGTVRWQTTRAVGQHYSTPLLIWSEDKPQVVANATTIIAYNPDTGEQLWSCRGMRPCVAPSPVFSDGLVYAASGRNGPAVVINPTGRGDITETHVKIHLDSGGPYVPSPLVYPCLMLPGDNGMMKFIDPQGKVVIEKRIEDIFTASPVGADGRIYWISERGKTYVIDTAKIASANPTAEISAVNQLPGQCLASPAIANGRIFIRTDKDLFCIAATAAGGHAPKSPAVSKSDKTAGKNFAELKAIYEQHKAEYSNESEKIIRLEAVAAIAKLKDPNVLPFLFDVAQKETHWDINEEATKLLYEQGQPAIPYLIELANNNLPFIKGIAIENLGKLKAVDATPALLKTVKDDDPLIRGASLRALGEICAATQSVPEEVFASVVVSLVDSQGSVKEAAIDSIVLFANKVSEKQRGIIIKGLENCVADKNPRVSTKARDALKNVYGIEAKVQDNKKFSFVRYDPNNQLIAYDAELQELYADDTGFEGPSWDPSTKKLYFAAWDKKQFLRLDEPGKVTICVNDAEDKIGINGSFATDKNRILTAQVYAHKIVRYPIDSKGLGQPEVLAYDANWFQPNDLTQSSSGDIYFSDPQWGGDHRGSAVYLLKPDGTVKKIITDMLAPNGLVVSPEGKTLYVADSLKKLWNAYPITPNGTVGAGKLFYKSGEEGSGSNPNDLPDGMTIDRFGNVYLTGLGGVRIVSGQGRLLWMINIAEKPYNLTLGGKERNILYVMCHKKVYGLVMNFGKKPDKI